MPKGIQLQREGENVFPRPYFAVGSIYISTVETSPASIYGGSWEQIKDTFLLACGDSFAAGTNGGEVNHTLTENEMPSHYHSGQNTGLARFTVSQSSSYQCWFYASGYNQLVSYNTGGNASHNNMPPYLSVYMWRRVS